MRNSVSFGLLATVSTLGMASASFGQLSYTGASRFVAVTGFGFFTDSGLDPFSATLGDPERTFASQSSQFSTSVIAAFGAAADAERAGMSVCTVDFDLAAATGYELSVTLLGEGSIARLVRVFGNDEQVVSALTGSNQLMLSTFTTGILEAGSYQYTVSTEGGPAIDGVLPWHFSTTLIVPAPAAAALPVVGLVVLRRRRRLTKI